MSHAPGNLLPSPRILMGFDPEFTAVMNEVMDLSRFAFQTGNRRTFPVTGTGRAGLEAAKVSLIEPGDRVAEMRS